MPGARDGTFEHKMKGYDSADEARTFDVRAHLPLDVEAYCKDMVAAGCRATATKDRPKDKNRQTYTIRIMRGDDELAAEPCADSMADLQIALANLLRTEPWLEKDAKPAMLGTFVVPKILSALRKEKPELRDALLEAATPETPEAESNREFRAKFVFSHRGRDNDSVETVSLDESALVYYVDMLDCNCALVWDLNIPERNKDGNLNGSARIVHVETMDILDEKIVRDNWPELQRAFMSLLLSEPWIKAAVNG